jgi:ribosomal protein S18 acetylase RimI-like enzyme
MKPTLRTINDTDYNAVFSLFRKIFPPSDTCDFQNAWKAKNKQSSMGLFDRSTLIGFGLVCENRLWFIAIDSKYQKYGYGSFLLRSIMSTMDSLCLTPVNEVKVIEWYKRHGFRITETMPFVHQDIPTCMMRWEKDYNA